MSTKDQDKHIQKALPDEALFVLMARDSVSPRVVVEWIKESITTQPAEKLHEALDCAIKMAMEQEKIFHAAKEKEKKDKEFKVGEDF
jgi:macrodomain Ter protein organizer (MatP/YcbG family)